MRVKFKDWECNVNKLSYLNGRIALQLTEVETLESIAMATVNIPEAPQYLPIELEHVYDTKGKELIYIKAWSDNEGIEHALHDAGIIELIGDVECPVSAYCAARVAVLTDKFLEDQCTN